MGQHRGEYDLSGRFMKPGSSSGSLGWPLLQAQKTLSQRKPHGTASTRERKSRSQKLQLPRLIFRRPLSVKTPSEPRFPQAVGWLCFHFAFSSVQTNKLQYRCSGTVTANPSPSGCAVRISARVRGSALRSHTTGLPPPAFRTFKFLCHGSNSPFLPAGTTASVGGGETRCTMVCRSPLGSVLWRR